MRQRLMTAMASVSMAVLTACHSSQPATTRVNPTPRLSGSPVSFDLYTHCGITGVEVAGSYYEADHPLNDGQGNPPKGWGNPTQPGMLSSPSPSTVEFRDKSGHDVIFHARASASPARCS